MMKMKVYSALCLRKQSHAYTYMYSENAYDVFLGSYYKIHVILRCRELEFFKNIEKWGFQDPVTFCCFAPFFIVCIDFTSKITCFI